MKTGLDAHTAATLQASSAAVVLEAMLNDLFTEIRRAEQDQLTLNPNDPRFGNNYITLQARRDVLMKLASSINEALNRKEL